MTKILEVNEDGALVIPADLLNGAGPHERFTAESLGRDLVVRPENPSIDEDSFLQALLHAGLVSEIKKPSRVSKLDRPAVPITGKPLSETIVEDRR